MRKILFYLVFVLSQNGFSQDTYKYFDLTLPDYRPTIFSKNIVSIDGRYENQCIFSPKGDLFFLVIGYGQEGGQSQTILRSFLKNEKWTSFDTINLEKDFSFTRLAVDFESNIFYFSSYNPTSDSTNNSENLWYSKFNNNCLSTPFLVTGLNTNFEETGPYFINKTLYFSSNRAEPYRLKVYKYFDNKISKLDFNFPDSLYWYENEINPIITKQGLIINKLGSKGYDLFVLRNINGKWELPKCLNLMDYFKGEVAIWSPTLTPDGKFLIFTVVNRESSDLYWVNLNELLDRLE